jgi:hypothetical protein
VRRTLDRFVGGCALAAILLAPSALAQSAMPLQSQERLIFVGIEADYAGLGVEEVTRRLQEDLEVKTVGTSLRSLANAQRRIFAVRSADPEATLKALTRGAKKAEWTAVERLQATVLDSGVDPFSSTTARLVEGNLDKVWSSWIGPRGETMWLFHESRLARRVLEKGLEKYEVRPNFHHRPFELSFTGEKEPDYAALETLAVEKLDLLRASRLEKGLALDVYLRGVDSLLLIEHGGLLHVCPDFVGPLIGTAKEAQAAWTVTFYSTGFPFL